MLSARGKVRYEEAREQVLTLIYDAVSKGLRCAALEGIAKENYANITVANDGLDVKFYDDQAAFSRGLSSTWLTLEEAKGIHENIESVPEECLLECYQGNTAQAGIHLEYRD